MKIKEGLESGYREYVELNSEDSYSKCILEYSEAWAEEMERHIDKGLIIEQCAEETGRLIDRLPKFGITGFMYGCSVTALSHFWTYGEELRVWHNSKYGQQDSKGVVNPAILCISTKED